MLNSFRNIYFKRLLILSFAILLSACSTDNTRVSRYESVKDNYKYYTPQYNSKGDYIGKPLVGTNQSSIRKGGSKVTTTNMSDGSVMRDSKAIQRATMRPYKVGGKWYYPREMKVGNSYEGIASWYGPNFHGGKTSNGEIYSMYARTAAHKTLPINTIVKVTNLSNSRETIVRINDRGPFVEGRIIDLSNTAAREIDMVKKGTAPVKLTILGFGGTISRGYKGNIGKHDDSVKVAEGHDTASVSSYMVQLGAFRNKSGAETYKETNDKYGSYKTRLVEGNYKNKPIYRVFITGFKTEEEANDFVKSKSLKGAIITSASQSN